jgi:DNA-binding CsgD family transcriptional regulator
MGLAGKFHGMENEVYKNRNRVIQLFHFILFLYVLSFLPGLIAMTMLGLAYLKHRAVLVKQVLFADIFFALVLLFDSMSHYLWLFQTGFSEWVHLMVVVGQYSAIVWKTYYLLSAAYCLLDRPFPRYFKTAGLSFVFGIFICLYLLYAMKVIPPDVALRTAFFASNIIAVSGSFGCILLLYFLFERISRPLRPVVKTCLIILAVTEPVSILQNIVNYLITPLKLQIAFSAILFCLLNLAGIIRLGRPFLADIHAKRPDPESPVAAPAVDLQTLVAQFDLTLRELEIIKLVLKGHSNQEIGAALYISPNTVKNHIYNIYKKVGVKNRLELFHQLLENVKT